MTAVVNVTDSDHLDRLLEDWRTVVILFTAPSWCYPCQRLEPHYDAVSEKLTEVIFAKVDIDKHPQISDDYGIMSVPTMLLYRRGQDAKRLVGRNVNQLYTEIKDAL